jgi:hypothetical protein
MCRRIARISPRGSDSEIAAEEMHRARGHRLQLQDRAAGRRLARAGLADEAQRLARRDVEGDAVDGAHRRPSAPRREDDREVAHAQQRFCASAHARRPAVSIRGTAASNAFV